MEIYDENTTSITENDIILNDDKINNNSLVNSSINHSLQTKYDKLIEEYDKMQINETDTDLNGNEIIVNELLLLYKDAIIKKGMDKDDYIKLIRQHIASKNKNESEIFNYLLDNNKILLF